VVSESPSFDSLEAMAKMLARREASSKELTERSLELGEETQKTLNCFRVIRHERAMKEAEEADRRLRNGERGALLGVPVAVKDDLDLAGETTQFGCPGDFAPKDASAEAIRRLIAAGAVVVGKTNTPELGLYPWTESPTFGATRNPWSLSHTPGGSSGGSAAAVAAGVVPAALGSDGAGSVRIPAAWTHLVGLKPQRGRISTWPEPESFHGLTCIGPLTRNVADAAVMLDVLRGNHPGDRHQPPPPEEPFRSQLEREAGPLRVGLVLEPPLTYAPARLDPQVKNAVLSLAKRLEALGNRVSHADPPWGLVGLAFVPRATASLYEWSRRLPDPRLLEPRTTASVKTGRLAAGMPLRLALAVEPHFVRKVGAAFARFDVLVTPTTATPPVVVGASDGLGNWATQSLMARSCPYAWPWNYLGWPALSVPAGLSAEGLPLGAQLLGPPNSEGLLLRLAATLESELRWDLLHPPERARPYRSGNKE